jgi:RNA polymerase sigma-70 factor (ECF subfamily)
LTDWATIVRDHSRMTFETAWRILGNASDTEDAVQEAFLDALRLAREGPVRNWGALLRRLAGCRALDLLRKRRALLPITAEPQAPPSAQPEAAAVADEQAVRLRLALAHLPEREAEVFALRYFGDLTNQEIAEVLHIAGGAVAVALHKARARLQTLLEPDKE